MLEIALAALVINAIGCAHWAVRVAPATAQRRYTCAIGAMAIGGTLCLGIRLFAPADAALWCVVLCVVRCAGAVVFSVHATRNWRSVVLSATLTTCSLSLEVWTTAVGLFGPPKSPWAFADAVCAWTVIAVAVTCMDTSRQRSQHTRLDRIFGLLSFTTHAGTYLMALIDPTPTGVSSPTLILATIHLTVATAYLARVLRSGDTPAPAPWELTGQSLAFTAAVTSGVMTCLLAAATLSPPVTGFGVLLTILLVASLLTRTHVTLFEYQRLAAQIRRERAHYTCLVEGSADVIGLCDAESCLVTYISPSAARVLDVDPADVAGKPLADVLGVPEIPLPPNRTTDANLTVEVAAHHATFELALAPHDEGWLFRLRDISEETELRRRLRWLAYHDELTGLRNRAGTVRRIQRLLDHPQQDALVAYIDLDRFKELNDTHGHAFGDSVLQHVASRLEASVPRRAVCGRLGGDEFVVIVPGMSSIETFAVAMTERLSEPYRIQDVVASVRASIGFTRVLCSRTPDEVLQAADAAMYSAKTEQADRVHVLTDAQAAGAHRTSAVVTYEPTDVPWFVRPSRVVSGGHEMHLTPDAHPADTSPWWRLPAPRVLDTLNVDRICAQTGLDAVHTVTVPLSASDCVNDRKLDSLSRFARNHRARGVRVRAELQPGPELHVADVMRERVDNLVSRGIEVGIDHVGSGYAFLGPMTILPISSVRTASWLVARRDLLEALLRILSASKLHVGVSGIDTIEQARYATTLGVQTYTGAYVGMPQCVTHMPHTRLPHHHPSRDESPRKGGAGRRPRQPTNDRVEATRRRSAPS